MNMCEAIMKYQGRLLRADRPSSLSWLTPSAGRDHLIES
jgi:hypothetical protein